MVEFLTKGQVFPVLDHGYVKVVDWMGSDETIIEAARMSTGKGFQGWTPGEICSICGYREEMGREFGCSLNGNHHVMVKISGDMNLLDYLWRNGHTTPFEMGEVHLEVSAPILVFRQWHRHRTMSYNEASARYAKMSDEHYLPTPDRILEQSQSNKQGGEDPIDEGEAREIIEDWRCLQTEVYKHYSVVQGLGVANETARLLTPVNRYSKMRVKTDLKNWLGFLRLRMHPHAQWEIRQYADVIGNSIIAQLFPRTWELFKEYTLNGTQLSRSEMRVVKLIAESLRSATKHGDAPVDVVRLIAESCLSEKKLEEFLKKLEKEG